MASKCLMVANLLRSNRSFTAAASPFAGRYHSLQFLRHPQRKHLLSHSSLGKGIRGSWMTFMTNPFHADGLGAMCIVDEYKLATVVRVDMPGILKDGLNVEIKNNEIHINGEEVKEPEYDDEDMVPRIYSGIVDVPSGLYNTNQITAEMKFGTLKIVIPKLNPEEVNNSNPNRNPNPNSFLVPPMVEFRDYISPLLKLNYLVA